MFGISYIGHRMSGAVLGVSLFLFAGLVMAAPTIRFSVPPWPGVEVETEVVSQVLDALGYQTKQISSAPALGIKSVASGNVDSVLAVWIPSEKSTLEAAMKTGNVVVSGTELKDALYGVVVPDYVWKAGVHSLADLHKHPDEFGKVIYGIDAGSDGNLIMKHAIENNTYDLQGWRVMPSSTSAMLVQAERRIKDHKWVAFLGWKPHWMNIVLNIKYLKDPKKIWGDNYVIRTIANKQFLEQHPNIKLFLKQFSVTSKTQSTWIYQFSFKKVAKDKVARQWIGGHMDVVERWLQGVKSVDGKPAAEVVKKAFSS